MVQPLYKKAKYGIIIQARMGSKRLPGKILKKTSTFFDVKCGEGIIRVLKIDKPNRFKLHQYL